MADPQYPNVPDAPGVPPVARQPGTNDAGSTSPPGGITGSGVETNANGSAQWGVFTTGGATIAEFDNIASFELQLDSTVPNYPVEGGGFASYNKVQRPGEYHVVATTGGTLDQRKSVLIAMIAAQQSIDLYNIVTPEATFTDVNVLSVRRSASADRGATLLSLEIGFEEIRQTASIAFTNTKDAASADPSQGGAVQATTDGAPASAAGQTR